MSQTLNPVDSAIHSRMSTRAFLPKAVPRETLEHLLEIASRAPSGTNTQPWKVYVLQGASRSLGFWRQGQQRQAQWQHRRPLRCGEPVLVA